MENETTNLEQQHKEHTFNEKILYLIAACVLALALVTGGILCIKSVRDAAKPATDVSQLREDEVITGEEATKEAEIKGAEAIDLIKSYPDEKLGVKKADYSFMIGQQAYVIDNTKYVQVIAAQKIENDDGSFQIIPHAKYYISFDGNTILKTVGNDTELEKLK